MFKNGVEQSFLYLFLPNSFWKSWGVRKLDYLSFIQKQTRRCSIKTGAVKSFTKFTGKHLCQSIFFNKVAGLRLLLFIIETTQIIVLYV